MFVLPADCHIVPYRILRNTHYYFVIIFILYFHFTMISPTHYTPTGMWADIRYSVTHKPTHAVSPVAFGVTLSTNRAQKCDISDITRGQWSVAALPLAIFGWASGGCAQESVSKDLKMSFCLSSMARKISKRRCHRSWFRHVERGRRRPVADNQICDSQEVWHTQLQKDFTQENCLHRR